MNATLSELHSRKSVRAFTAETVSPDQKRALFEAALQAPTAGNMTLYTILDITDPALKTRLSETCDHQPFIATAPVVLVFCADYKRWYDVFCRYNDTVRKPSAGDLLLAQADTLIAAQNTVVAAESMGLGSCYIGDITENYELHKELLGLPDYVVPTAMLVIGHPTDQQKSRPKPPRFAVEDVVHTNAYDPTKNMAQMLKKRQELDESAFADWIVKFCKRKWNSDFSIEMSRSCKAIINDFCKKE
ncbi:MAG: nitroreductase family protein [Clostridia bacterium]|nr:nitroreductase family protein [Clostridia bacterium]